MDYNHLKEELISEFNKISDDYEKSNFNENWKTYYIDLAKSKLPYSISSKLNDRDLFAIGRILIEFSAEALYILQHQGDIIFKTEK